MSLVFMSRGAGAGSVRREQVVKVSDCRMVLTDPKAPTGCGVLQRTSGDAVHPEMINGPEYPTTVHYPSQNPSTRWYGRASTGDCAP